MLEPWKSMLMASGALSRPLRIVCLSLSLPDIFHIPICLRRVHEFGSVIKDEETFYAKAFDDDLAEAGEGGILASVAGDQAAENYAAVKIHAIENGLHDVSRRRFQSRCRCRWAWRRLVFLPIGKLVIDGGIKAEIVLNPLTFFIGTGNADDAAAVNFADLTGNASSGAGRRGDDESFAGLGFADFEKAEIGSEAIDAESAEEIGVGEEGNGRKLLEGAFFLAGDEDIFLKASEAHDLVTFFEIGMAGFDNFGETEGTHNIADLDGRHVLGDIGHPDAHRGVDGEVFDASEGLAIFEEWGWEIR